jgi:phosphoglucomutase
MEDTQPVEEINEIKGLFFMPQTAQQQKFGELDNDEGLQYNYYDPAKHSDENLNYKFLLPALESIKGSDLDFVLGFDHGLQRMIIGYPNPDGKFLVFNAHQQAAMLAHYFLRANQKETDRLVVKGLVLSQQIDKIITKNGGIYRESHAGYDHLKEVISSVDKEVVFLAFDEKNHVMMNLEAGENINAILRFFSEMMAGLKAQKKGLYDYHVDIQVRYKLYAEKTFNISSEGENKKIFDRFRLHPPSDAMHEELVSISDFKKRLFSNKLTGRKSEIELEQMDLVQLEYSSGLKITVEMTDEGSKLFLHLSDYTDCYNKESFPEARKNIHDRLLKVVVSLGKMVINVN